MALICNREGCTLAQTGTCVFDRDPESCEDRLKSLSLEDKDGNESANAFLEPVLGTPVENTRFKANYTLTPVEADLLMRKKYCRIIGILGSPGAGKTACLVSLYLLLSRNSLQGFSFRNSLTLRALEEISRGARRWNETNSPQQLTLHTEIQDERTAGFLHFRLFENNSNKNFDLLLPDLPGEWTSTLIDEKRSDRLSFLQSAEDLWLFVSGSEIADKSKRQLTIHRLSLLLERIAVLLGDLRPNITVVVTHADTNEVVISDISKLISKGQELGFEIDLACVASFSSKDGIPPGQGITQLIKKTLTKNVLKEKKQFWANEQEQNTKRQIFKFSRA